MNDDAGSPADGSVPVGRVLAVGVDVVSIERIADLVGRFDGSFLERVYTPAERAYCSAQPRPDQHYAARWAAKEATLKALPDTGTAVPVGSVAVGKDGPRPRLELSGPAEGAAVRLADRAGVDPDRLRTAVSLAHDRSADCALAHAVFGRQGDR